MTDPPACLIRGLYGKLGDLCSLQGADQPHRVMDRHDNVAAKSREVREAIERMETDGRLLLAYDLFGQRL